MTDTDGVHFYITLDLQLYLSLGSSRNRQSLRARILHRRGYKEFRQASAAASAKRGR